MKEHGGSEDAAQFVQIWRDWSATMNEALEICPMALQMGMRSATRCSLADSLPEQRQPRRHTGDDGDVPRRRSTDNRLELRLPVGYLRRGSAGFVKVFLCPRRKSQGGDATQFAS